MVKGDKKKGDDPKTKDTNSNIDGTAGAHVEDTTTTEESTVHSRGASIGAHILRQMNSCLVYYVL